MAHELTDVLAHRVLLRDLIWAYADARVRVSVAAQHADESGQVAADARVRALWGEIDEGLQYLVSAYWEARQARPS